MEYKFSVIIPVYNAEKTIRRCLDSLLSQNYHQAEIILVNDGSKDRSADICQEYASKYNCIVYIEQENAGVSSARNTALNIASGEYILFVDSDDYVSDNYFSELEHTEEDFIVFSYETIKGNEKNEYTFTQKLQNATCNTEIILETILSRLAAPWNKRFKKSIVENNQIRFKQDLTIGEDFIFGLEYMLLCTSCRVNPACLYCVDQTGTESITRAAKYGFEQYLLIYDYAFRIAENCCWNMPEKAQLLQQLDYLYCRTAFASTQHCITGNKKAMVQPKKLVEEFHRQYRSGIKPTNLIHAVMQICIKASIYPVFWGVAHIHAWMLIKQMK